MTLPGAQDKRIFLPCAPSYWPLDIFYGWWIVAACLTIAVVSWGLGIFGIGVYIHALTRERGFSISLLSIAITCGQFFNAVSLISIGSAIDRFGPRAIFALGGLFMAIAMAALAYSTDSWHLFAAFTLMGIARSLMSPTSISTTLAPWFERHQGRAVSVALLGASIAGMIGTPLLLWSNRINGFSNTSCMQQVLAFWCYGRWLSLSYVTVRKIWVCSQMAKHRVP